jgi:Putative antitoxin
VSATLDRPTTITVTEKTRRLLEAVKGAGESFDDLIQDLLEETFFDDKFYAEIERRWQTEKRVPGNRVMKKAGLV